MIQSRWISAITSAVCSCREYQINQWNPSTSGTVRFYRSAPARHGLLHKWEALKGSRIKPQHYALVIREACGGIIIISADQKITNNNGHQRGGTRGHVSLQSARKHTNASFRNTAVWRPMHRNITMFVLIVFTAGINSWTHVRINTIKEIWDIFLLMH